MDEWIGLCRGSHDNGFTLFSEIVALFHENYEFWGIYTQTKKGLATQYLVGGIFMIRMSVLKLY